MGKKILIVEDESDILEAMADALRIEGYTVETAENGQIGLMQALKNKPDLILLDIMMPAMDGHEVLAKLRADHWGKTAKVIVMSAMDDVENIGQGFEQDINDYIIKSNMSLAEVVKVVNTVLTD